MLLSLVSALVMVTAANAAPKGHPCKAIVDACTEKGFVRGEYKEGTGLWKDCVDPLMQGKPQPANAKLPLPTVDTQLISECKKMHGTFGEGRQMHPHSPSTPPPPAAPTK